MARLAFGGFEGGHWDCDGFDSSATSGTVVMQAGGARSGDYCAKCPGTGRLAYPTTAVGGAVSGRTYRKRYWFRVDAYPSVGGTLTLLRLSSSNTFVADLGSVVMDDAGRLAGFDGTLSAAVALNTDFCVEVEYVADGVNVTRRLRVNGTLVGAAAAVASAAQVTWIGAGVIASSGATTPNVLIDDWALNDDQGVLNNSWPGLLEKTVALIAVADLAIGTQWKLGDLTAPPPAFEAVNNRPPIGVSSGTATAGSQLKDTSSTTTQPDNNADFTLSSYIAKGLVAADTIIATQAVLVGAVNSTTLNLGIRQLTNPVDPGEVVSSGFAASGTFPSAWKALMGKVSESPTPVLATQPTLRIRKASTTAATYQVCYVAVNVAYIPSASPSGQLYPSGKQGASPLSGQLFPRGVRAA